MANRWFQVEGDNINNEHRRRVAYQVYLRRILRDTLNPYDISVTEFVKLYRLPQPTVLEIVTCLRPYIFDRRNNYCVPLEIKILVALAIFASGSYQRIVGNMMFLSVGEATVSNIVSEMTDLLNNPNILARFIRFPTTQEERQQIIRRNERLGMPWTLGFIHGTLVKLSHLPDNSIGRFTSAARVTPPLMRKLFPGSCNDTYIWSQCAVRNAVIRAYHASRCWLLGDSGYIHEPWLQIPLPHALPGTPEFAYTKLHCYGRIVVERCIGFLKARWRCLLCDRTLHYSPDKCGRIINACCVLHNFCLMRNVPEPYPERDDGENGRDSDEEEEEDGDIIAVGALAQRERQFLINYAHQHHMDDEDEE